MATSARATVVGAGTVRVEQVADRDTPAADRFEQGQPVAPGADVDAAAPADAAAEVPEADALEQARAVGSEPRVPIPSRDSEVPEADSLEQAEEVVDDDEGWSRP